MRPDCHWLRVLRAWTALVIAVAHLLLALSVNVTRAATGPAEHGIAIQDTQDVGAVLCVPGGSSVSPEAPGKPAPDHHNDCCTSCAATGPVAVPAPFPIATVIPVTAGAGVVRYAAPFILDAIDRLPSSPRAPPAIA